MLIECRPLPTFVTDDLTSVRAAFRGATPIPLRQAWLAEPEPDLAQAIVRTGWHTDSLLVFAELSDHDIFTRAQQHNGRFWELGDTFEMFLQPAADLPYCELHVAPNNLRLQLRFDAPPSGADPFVAALIHGDVFESRTWVNHDTREWCVLATIPAAVVGPHAAVPVVPLEGSTWRFSFSRYDHTRDRDAPVISSSSPHSEPAFHRPHEWGWLHFCSSRAI